MGWSRALTGLNRRFVLHILMCLTSFIISSNEIVQLAELERLVDKHTIEPHWRDRLKAMTQQRVDWTAIGKELNRVPRECCDKWQPIALAKRTNTFTPQDDALILRREKEWGDRGAGLWAALEKEMKRPERNIRRRWKEIYEVGP